MNLANTLLSTHGLDAKGWKIVFDSRSKRRLGYTRYATKEIGLSTYHISNHSDADIRDTILHEIAHAIAGPTAKHGTKWRAVARSVGARPRASKPVTDNRLTIEEINRLRSQPATPVRRRTVKPAPVRRNAPAWVVGSSNWDEMFGD